MTQTHDTAAAALPALAVFLVLVGQALAPGPAAGDAVGKLPLIEVAAAAGANSDLLAVFITGDGGFGAFDKRITATLASEGVPVVAVNALKYFWRRHEPEESARDFERLLDRYFAAWHKKRAVLIGYSLGADVLPFIVTRLKPEVKNRVDTVALIGPALSVDFKFHFSYWFLRSHGSYPMSVADEAKKLNDYRVLCVNGEQEKHSLCRDGGVPGMKVAEVDCGHIFKKHYRRIADLILSETDPGVRE